jgi:hypothetical protein
LQLGHQLVTTTASETTLYTVPAGDRIILRSVVMQNMASSAQGCLIYLPGGFQVFFHQLGAHNSGTDSFEWRPWIVATPGQTITAKVGNATGVDVLLSGSIYTI